MLRTTDVNKLCFACEVPNGTYDGEWFRRKVTWSTGDAMYEATTESVYARETIPVKVVVTEDDIMFEP